MNYIYMKNIIKIAVVIGVIMVCMTGCMSRGSFSLFDFNNMNETQIKALAEEYNAIYNKNNNADNGMTDGAKGSVLPFDVVELIRALGTFRLQVFTIRWDVTEEAKEGGK